MPPLGASVAPDTHLVPASHPTATSRGHAGMTSLVHGQGSQGAQVACPASRSKYSALHGTVGLRSVISHLWGAKASSCGLSSPQVRNNCSIPPLDSQQLARCLACSGHMVNSCERKEGRRRGKALSPPSTQTALGPMSYSGFLAAGPCRPQRACGQLRPSAGWPAPLVSILSSASSAQPP